MKKSILFLATTFLTLAAHAETWDCKSSSGETMTVKVSADGKSVGQISGIFSFQSVDVAGDKTSLSGQVVDYDSYDATVTLSRDSANPATGTAHAVIDINIDCLGEANYDLQMQCQISE
ncbi:hypothetical protein [Bdellovibrio sp. NC01]|uniref:hypothetical protein n=1 Tax=Bdellovibrio sp. NC01 TaxID=2220073 RepID=UPI00115B0C20|nr:hypothetical protein [Bdellovibrio sp. NC01]QDK37622.1 hypothetical protein DOE51_08515 [Bdellovibrio sp. NC01]